MSSTSSAALVAIKAAHQMQNEMAAIYFAASMGGIMAVFVISQFVKAVLQHSRPGQNGIVTGTR
jgi:hypothetical protein